MDIGIIGCQRCGTTLMGLILSAHPQIEYFSEPGQYAYWNRESRNDFNAFALVTQTQHPSKIRTSTKLIFMQRNITDVVASMLRLNWIVEGKAGHEIKRAIDENVGEYRNYLITMFHKFKGRYDHRMGALVAQMKFNYYDEYKNQIRPIHLVRYENLVTNPKDEIESICKFLNIYVCDSMLSHERLNKGFEMHGTRGERKIDTASINKAKDTLTADQIQEVLHIAEDVRNNYKLMVGDVKFMKM